MASGVLYTLPAVSDACTTMLCGPRVIETAGSSVATYERDEFWRYTGTLSTYTRMDTIGTVAAALAVIGTGFETVDPRDGRSTVIPSVTIVTDRVAIEVAPLLSVTVAVTV